MNISQGKRKQELQNILPELCIYAVLGSAGTSAYRNCDSKDRAFAVSALKTDISTDFTILIRSTLYAFF